MYDIDVLYRWISVFD